MPVKLQTDLKNNRKIKNVQECSQLAFDDRLTCKEIMNNKIEVENGANGSICENIKRREWVLSQAEEFKEKVHRVRSENYFYQPRYQLLFEYLKTMPRDIRFLELGCFDAAVSRQVFRMGFTDVTATDLGQVIEHVMAEEGIRLVSLDLNKEFVEGSFDLIYAGELIEHLYNDYAFLVNCYNHTSQGGLLIITSPQDPPAKRWYEGGNHIRCYPDHTLAGLVASVGYKIERFHVQLNLTATGPRTTGIVFGRKVGTAKS